MVLLSQQSDPKRGGGFGDTGNRIYSVHFDFMVQRTVKTRGTGSMEKSKMRAMMAPVKHRRVRRVDIQGTHCILSSYLLPSSLLRAHVSLIDSFLFSCFLCHTHLSVFSLTASMHAIFPRAHFVLLK
jgi:hypothetical protein